MTIPSNHRAPSNGRVRFGTAGEPAGAGAAGVGGGRPASRNGGPVCRIAGDPAGRRVVLIHGDSTEARGWDRLLPAVPAGQEWVSVVRARADGGAPGLLAAALRPLLAVRRLRKTLLVGCGAGVPEALRVALDGPDLVGGLLLIDPADADEERPGMFRRIAARLRSSAADGATDGLRELAPLLGAIRMPVMVLQGRSDPSRPNATSTLERALTGCRTLTVVTVPAARVVPSRHEGALRGALTALTALAAAVERGDP